MFEEISELRFCVSSRHLILASPCFQTMLQGSWKESLPTESLLRTVDASDWHIEALKIMLDIIHGHSHKIPRYISLALLAHIAVVVDYYKCHDAVKFFLIYGPRILIGGILLGSTTGTLCCGYL